MESARVNQINNMETKQKTWEDCCNQIAKDNGWDNWESVLISKMSLESKSILTYKAAELFNSSIAEERDELKEKLKIAIDGISDLEKEYRKTEAELNSYSRIAHQLKNERLKGEIHKSKRLTNMKDNELIAEFMGFTYYSTEHDTFWNPPDMPKASPQLWKYHSLDLDHFYPKSWAWLMPVVEKITPIARGENENKSLDVAWGDISGPLVRGDINGVYAYVVNFIKRYNSQNHKP